MLTTVINSCKLNANKKAKKIGKDKRLANEAAMKRERKQKCS